MSENSPTRNGQTATSMFRIVHLLSIMLSKLPEYLIAAIISVWLELTDLAKLDTSSNHVDRNELSNIMSSKWFEFIPMQSFFYRSRASKMEWTHARNISLQNAAIGYQYVDNIDREMLIDWVGHGKLRRLYVTTTGMEGTRVPMVSLCLDLVWKHIVTKNSCLIDLEICDVNNMEWLLSFIGNNAPQLLNLQLTACSKSKIVVHYIQPVLTLCVAIHRLVVKQSPHHCYSDGISVIIDDKRHVYISMRQIHYDDIADLQNDMLTLNSVKLMGFRAHGISGKTFKNECFVSMMEHKNTLREVLITNVTFGEIKRVIIANPNLHKLEVRFNENKSSRLASPDYRDVFANGNHRIVSLRASHTTWHGDGHVKIATINAILKACPQLKDFEFNISENDHKGKKLRRYSTAKVMWTDDAFTMF